MKVTTTETVKYRFAAVGILAALALVCTLAMGGCTTEKPAAENEDDLVAADQIAESEEVPTASEDAMLYDTQNTNAQDQAAASTPTAAEGANEATQTNNNSDSSDTNAAIEPNNAGSTDVNAQDKAAASTPTAAEGANEPTKTN